MKRQCLQKLLPEVHRKDQQIRVCCSADTRIHDGTRVFRCLIAERTLLWQTQANASPARNRCLKHISQSQATLRLPCNNSALEFVSSAPLRELAKKWDFHLPEASTFGLVFI